MDMDRRSEEEDWFDDLLLFYEPDLGVAGRLGLICDSGERVYVDKDGYPQEFRGLSRAFNREFWNIGKLVSGLLRHGMPLPNLMTLIDTLDIGENESISSWKNGVKRMIKKYIKDGTVVKGVECPTCNSTNLVYKEGCVTCLDCDWSKCE